MTKATKRTPDDAFIVLDGGHMFSSRLLEYETSDDPPQRLERDSQGRLIVTRRELLFALCSPGRLIHTGTMIDSISDLMQWRIVMPVDPDSPDWNGVTPPPEKLVRNLLEAGCEPHEFVNRIAQLFLTVPSAESADLQEHMVRMIEPSESIMGPLLDAIGSGAAVRNPCAHVARRLLGKFADSGHRFSTDALAYCPKLAALAVAESGLRQLCVGLLIAMPFAPASLRCIRQIAALDTRCAALAAEWEYAGRGPALQEEIAPDPALSSEPPERRKKKASERKTCTDPPKEMSEAERGVFANQKAALQAHGIDFAQSNARCSGCGVIGGLGKTVIP